MNDLPPIRLTAKQHEALEKAFWESVEIINDGFEGKRPWRGLTLKEANDLEIKAGSRLELIAVVEQVLKERNT